MGGTMSEPVVADPSLYQLANGVVLLRACKCSICGYVFFPPHGYGCESCGAGPQATAEELVEPSGVASSVATVHHNPFAADVPYAIAEIMLDSGPTIRGLLDSPVGQGASIGSRVSGTLVPNGTRRGEADVLELRFSPATSEPTPRSAVSASAPPSPVPGAAPIASGARLCRLTPPPPRRPIGTMRPVYVVGVGLHRYQRPSDTTYVDLGLTAVRSALDDAGIEWPSVDAAYTATVNVGFAAGRTMLRYLGTTGIAMSQVENASASGSTGFRSACVDVASGTSEVALAIGVDKVALPNMAPGKAGIHDLIGARLMPVTHFALLANAYMNTWDIEPEVLGLVAVKNHRNGAENPYAQRQKVRSLADVMADPPLSGSLTRLQCCPIGEGAAAAIVASEDAIASLGLDESRCVRVLSSVAASERVYSPGVNWDTALTGDTTERALAEAQISPDQLDVVEVHDAFTIEELLYIEAMGLCEPGQAAPLLVEGAWDIGGRCAVSPSGGLVSMGHPFGPTGVGQVAEVTRQLRGEAGARQQPGAQFGLAHMVGVGAVCVVHVLSST